MPDLCAFFQLGFGETEIRLVNLYGEVEWAVPAVYGSQGCTMADLDGDGLYEVLALDDGGLHILSGQDGTLLAEDTTFIADADDVAPIVADIDGDGSAEIVSVGSRLGADHVLGSIRAWGPATGSWAKTRPIWNQEPYDPMLVADDGTFIPHPRPNWQAYNTLRAQPSRDGLHPDLTVLATDVCVEDCQDGPVHVAVQVVNQGGAEAAAGAVVTLHTHTSAGWREVASLTIAEPIPPLTALDGFAFEVPLDQWGDHQVLDVTAAHADECDLTNDRVPVSMDVCAGS